LGPPGSGKGTLAKNIVKKYGTAHISTGDMLRTEISKKSDLGLAAKGYVDKGALVPDEVIIAMVGRRLSDPDCVKGIILDGFPRTVNQAKALCRVVDIDLCIEITSSEDLIFERICSRRVCRACGYVTNTEFIGNSLVCPECSGELYLRDDDKEETIKSRLDVYFTETAPLTEYYSKMGKLVQIESKMGRDKIFDCSERIGKVLKMIELKTRAEIEKMREAGKIAHEIIHMLGEKATPGITTKQLDDYCQKLMDKYSVEASFKGYRGYPAAICTSLNDEIVHGIPSDKVVLKEGDIVGIDIGVKKNGYHADMARTFGAGNISSEAKLAIFIARECFGKGVEKFVIGGRLHDICASIENTARLNGATVPRELIGHGIGRNLHEPPDVPNYKPVGAGIRLKKGLVLAIEPMINLGVAGVKSDNNGWTVRTKDGRLSAHYENTVALGDNGAEILTAQ